MWPLLLKSMSFHDSTYWINPQDGTAPPVMYFQNDASVGLYSVQFTATDEYAWSGIDGTKECDFQGLCHPQYVFYRDGYNIILNTWRT